MPSLTFPFTGAEQTFIVPAGVHEIALDVAGAAGNAPAAAAPSLVSHGGRVRAVLPVTPGETLHVYVGGRSDAAIGVGGFADATPGWNGGGTGGFVNVPPLYSGGGGGGASDIRQAGNTVAERVAVGGGGGGLAVSQLANPTGGNGGDPDGYSGVNAAGGGGATQAAVGSGGNASGPNSVDGNPGVGETGGDGVAEASPNGPSAGGGGGGGYFGGGGGGAGHYDGVNAALSGGGGGGGSSWAGPSCSDVVYGISFQPAGSIVLSWKSPDTGGVMILDG